MLSAGLAAGQEALRTSMAGDAAAEARSRQQQSQAYTVKSGDFRLLVTPSLSLDWNDNINTRAHKCRCRILYCSPALGLDMSYPLTQRNLLRLNVTFGYQDYLEHSEYSTWNVQSGSALSYDIYVKDFWINLHDRFSYVQDSSQQAAVANTGTYGTAQNTAGFNTTWDLEDVTLSLGYDHQNYSSTSQQFSYTDRASELVVGRGGFKFHPTLTAGLEGTVSYTAYDQQVLNNNMGYSAGVYADWQPGHYLHVQPRFGYTLYQFQQTSQVIKAVRPGRVVPRSDRNPRYQRRRELLVQRRTRTHPRHLRRYDRGLVSPPNRQLEDRQEPDAQYFPLLPAWDPGHRKPYGKSCRKLRLAHLGPRPQLPAHEAAHRRLELPPHPPDLELRVPGIQPKRRRPAAHLQPPMNAAPLLTTDHRPTVHCQLSWPRVLSPRPVGTLLLPPSWPLESVPVFPRSQACSAFSVSSCSAVLHRY